jgi:hypothetical protein
MDKRALEFLHLLASRMYTGEQAKAEFVHIAVNGVLHRELKAILRTEGSYGPEINGTREDSAANGESA